MTSPISQITVRCPQCHASYETWHRPSMNLTMDDFDEDYIEEMSTATCPHCGLKVALDTLVIREAGTIEMAPPSVIEEPPREGSGKPGS